MSCEVISDLDVMTSGWDDDASLSAAPMFLNMGWRMLAVSQLPAFRVR